MSLDYVYSTGTVSVGNGSVTVTGVGTQWVAAGIREGDDFRANGLVAVIASVNSNTSITLRNGWPGAGISGNDYNIRLIDDAQRGLAAFNSLLLALGSGNLTSLAGLNGAANQMPYFTGAGVMDTTGLTSQARTLLASTLLSRSGNNLVTVGAGTRITGPAVTQSATDTTAGRLMKTGDGGWLSPNIPTANEVADFLQETVSRAAAWSGASGTNGPGVSNGAAIILAQTAATKHILTTAANGISYARIVNGAFNRPWARMYDTANTTVDSNGFIKAASPIIRLYNDRIEEPVERVGAEMTRNGVGEYTLSGVPPMATDGWRIEVPQDHNGNRLVFVEVEYVDAIAALIVTTSKPLWSMETMSWAPGDPVDIPDGRWVDLRFWKDPAQEEATEEE